MSKKGVYIHIPFCLRKCNYCDFLSFVTDEPVYRAYKDALLNEIAYSPPFGDIDTIFIGGGTPSVLPAYYIEEVLDKIGAKGEVTIEANPATVTAESLQAYRRMGINRLSIGLQSANDKELAALGRLHNYNDFRQNYIAAREAGFTNINVDLMFSLPGQSLGSWQNTLGLVTELGPEHISAYGLMIEDGTDFAKMQINVDEGLDREMYALVCEALSGQGYERYEISNFAKPGFQSFHNKKYWTRSEYIGLGLGAHSFMNETRWRNTEILDEYIVNNGIPEKVRRDITIITKTDAMAEFMFLGLRLSGGVSREDFYKSFGYELDSVYGEQISKHIALGTLAEERCRLYLTGQGVNVSNVVMREFL